MLQGQQQFPRVLIEQFADFAEISQGYGAIFIDAFERIDGIALVAPGDAGNSQHQQTAHGHEDEHALTDG